MVSVKKALKQKIPTAYQVQQISLTKLAKKDKIMFTVITTGLLELDTIKYVLRSKMRRNTNNNIEILH